MIEKAIEVLKEHGMEPFELAGVLTIPCDGLEALEPTVNKVRHILKDCGYNKSWRVDPYHNERQKSLAAQMFGGVKK